MAMSLAQLLPQSELLVITTPQTAAADVAVRAGMMALHTKQRVIGVVENMAGLPCPHCGEPIDLFGSGGGNLVAQVLTKELGTDVQVMARIPFDVRLREGGDNGAPLVVAEPEVPAAEAITQLAAQLAGRPRGLVGCPWGLPRRPGSDRAAGNTSGWEPLEPAAHVASGSKACGAGLSLAGGGLGWAGWVDGAGVLGCGSPGVGCSRASGAAPCPCRHR